MNKKNIDIEYCDKVAVLKLNRNITNALDLALLNELAGILETLKNDSNVQGVVFTSTNEKFFSIGFDIPQLFELSEDDFAVFYRTFNRTCLDLYTLPKPTIAAIIGHAVAGGCIVALCCDYRIIAEGKKKMGLNEIKLGVPVPYLADCILRQIVGYRNAREIMDTGEFYEPENLLQLGIADMVLPVEQVLAQSIEKAKLLGSMPHNAFAMIKGNRVEMVLPVEQVLAQSIEKAKLLGSMPHNAFA
ncbi:MAG: enoyl-CoA hydratase/isomerase family protein, partial [candidate division WOR-3 bacterium]